MEIFYEQLLSLLLLLTLLLTGVGVYTWAKRGLERSAATGGRERGGDAPEVHRPWVRKSLRWFMGEVRAFCRELPGALRRNNRVTRDLLKGVAEKKTITNLVSDIVMVLLISLAMAYYCSAKQGGLDLYMSTFIPLVGVMLLIFWFTETMKSSRPIAFCAAVLIFIGMSLQILLKLPAEDPNAASELVIFAMVSVVLGLIAVPIIRLFCCELQRDHAVFILNVLVILVYLLLLAVGREVNGTKAWLVVGGMSFQLTEVTKTLSCAVFALQFTDENVTVRGDVTEEKKSDRRLWNSLVTLAINGVFLLWINELGTLCVLGLVFFVLAMVYLTSVKKLLAMVLVCFLLVGIVLMGCSICYNIKYAEPAETTAASEPAEQPAESTPAGEAQPKEHGAIVNLGARIYKKFKVRMDLIFAPETVDPYNEGYQTMKARNALLMAGWLGSEYEVSIPVVSSDFIFAYLVMKMGILFGILVILLVLVLLCTGTMGCLRNRRNAEASVALAFLLAITLQSLVAAASASGLFIMIGMPFAFLAEGGSASVMNYVMLLFILYANRSIEATSGRRPPARNTPLARKDG